MTEAIDRARGRLDEKRRAAEHRLDEVRRSLDRELGAWPTTRAWLLPVVAFGVGLAIAAWLRRR